MNTYEELILQVIIEEIANNDFVTRKDIEDKLNDTLGDEKVIKELSPYIKGVLDVTFRIFE